MKKKTRERLRYVLAGILVVVMILTLLPALV